jgi:DNA-binding MarR family transcriptional regulator
MKLEDEIQQKKFRSEHHKGAVNVIYTANWLTSIHGSYLKRFDLTPEQFNILRILRGQYPEPATVNLLIDRMLNKMSNASRLVDKLVVKKLVQRNTCREDRRAVDVVITKKGLDLLEEIDKVEKEWLENISGLSAAEMKTLNKLLDKMRG